MNKISGWAIRLFPVAGRETSKVHMAVARRSRGWQMTTTLKSGLWEKSVKIAQNLNEIGHYSVFHNHLHKSITNFVFVIVSVYLLPSGIVVMVAEA
jgi:hypothetical protein